MADGLRITCTLDKRKLAAVQKAIGERTMRRAVAKSLNRAGVTMRKEAAQRIHTKLRLKIGEIKDALPIRNKPNAGQAIGEQYIEVMAQAKPISLSRFKPKQTKRGVAVNITGKRTLIPHAFMAKRSARYESGAVWIRTRYMKGKGSVGSFRWGKHKAEFPINKMALHTIHTMLMQHSADIHKIGKQRFGKEFASNYAHELKKAGL